VIRVIRLEVSYMEKLRSSIPNKSMLKDKIGEKQLHKRIINKKNDN